MNISTNNYPLSTIACYDPNIIANNYKALLILDRCFFTKANNIQDNKVLSNFLKHHYCIMWDIKTSHEDETIYKLPFVKGHLCGLIDKSKKMTYIRNMFRSQKDILSLPSILIDDDLSVYNYSGFDHTIDLRNYNISGFTKVINMTKVIKDINEYLHIWYNFDYQYTEQAINGIVTKNNVNKLDYKF